MGLALTVLGLLVSVVRADTPRDQLAHFDQLNPYTLYEYEARCDGKTMRSVFHTARAASQTGPIRFVVIGDTQTGWQYHENLSPLIAAENPDFVLQVDSRLLEPKVFDITLKAIPPTAAQ